MVLAKLTYSTLGTASISGLLTMDAFYCTENVVSQAKESKISKWRHKSLHSAIYKQTDFAVHSFGDAISPYIEEHREYATLLNNIELMSRIAICF